MALPASTAFTRRRFTVAEYHKMGEIGIFHEDDHEELIEGEIFQLPRIQPRRASVITHLNLLFFNVLTDLAIISVRSPIDPGHDSEPQPDVALLKPRLDFYASALPTPKDIILLVEISDSWPAYIRDVKVPLYARAGISELWHVDLEGDTLIVFRDPGSDGYVTSRVACRGDWLAPLAFPGREIAVSDILG